MNVGCASPRQNPCDIADGNHLNPFGERSTLLHGGHDVGFFGLHVLRGLPEAFSHFGRNAELDFETNFSLPGFHHPIQLGTRRCSVKRQAGPGGQVGGDLVDDKAFLG